MLNDLAKAMRALDGKKTSSTTKFIPSSRVPWTTVSSPMHVWWLYTRPFLFDLQRVAHIFLAYILQMTFQTLDSVDLLYASVNLFPQLRKRPSLIVFFKSVDVASPVNKLQLICRNSRPGRLTFVGGSSMHWRLNFLLHWRRTNRTRRN